MYKHLNKKNVYNNKRMGLIFNKIKDLIKIDIKIPKKLFFRGENSFKKVKKTKTIYRISTVLLILLASIMSGNLFGIPKPMYNKIYLWIWNKKY